LLIFNTKEIRNVETETTPSRIQSQSCSGRLKGEETVSELATRFGVHPTMIHKWKRALIEGASDVFERGRNKPPEVAEKQIKDLHAKIGELAIANGFLHESSSIGPRSEAWLALFGGDYGLAYMQGSGLAYLEYAPSR